MAGLARAAARVHPTLTGSLARAVTALIRTTDRHARRQIFETIPQPIRPEAAPRPSGPTPGASGPSASPGPTRRCAASAWTQPRLIRSARGTHEHHGTLVGVQRDFSRRLSDVAPGEQRAELRAACERHGSTYTETPARDSSNRSETGLRPRPKRRTIAKPNTRPWPRDSHKMVSGIPGAVQGDRSWRRGPDIWTRPLLVTRTSDGGAVNLSLLGEWQWPQSGCRGCPRLLSHCRDPNKGGTT